MQAARRGRARARDGARQRGRREIRRLAAQNPSFTGDLLRAELVKTDRLVDAFIDMAVTCARYERLPRLRGHRRPGKGPRDGYEQSTQGRRSRRRRGPTSRGRTSPIILAAPREDAGNPSATSSVARGQLDLIENSFQLIADQIVTMQSPQELSGQLDELLDGVESIRQTAAGHREDPERHRHRAGDVTWSTPCAAAARAETRTLPAWAEDLRRRYLAARPRCSSSTATCTTSSSSAGRCSRSRTSSRACS